MLLQIFVRAKRSLWSRDKDAFKLAVTFRNDKLETRCIMTIRSNVIDPKPRLSQEACRFSSTFVTDSLPGETVTTYSYTRILFRCSPPLLSRDDFSGGEKMRETRRCGRSVGYTRVQESVHSRSGWVHTKGAADYGDLRSAGREIIPWSGEQKGERFVRPSRNFMAPRVQRVGGDARVRFNIN